MKKYTFFLFILLSCLLAGCNETTVIDLTKPVPTPEVVEPDITIDSGIINNGLSFSSAAGDATVSFSTGGAWTLSIASTTSGNTWCRASVTSGAKGKHSVKFTVDDNDGYDDRSVAVTIKSGGSSRTFTVTQKSREALLVTTSKYELPKEGGKITLQVKSNVDYKLTVSGAAAEWLTEEDAGGRALTERKHVFRVAASDEADSRQGEIILSYGDLTETVNVYQAGEPAIVLPENEIVVDHAGDTISVDIASNVEFGVQLPEVDWLTDLASSRGMSSHTLQYAVAPNDSYTGRSAQIIFFDKNSDLADTLTVRQTAVEIKASGYQLFEREKDGLDAVIIEDGTYAFLKETPDSMALALVIGKRGAKGQDILFFDGTGSPKSMVLAEGDVFTFEYMEENMLVVDSLNTVVANIPYSAFPKIDKDAGTRAFSFSGTPLFEALKIAQLITGFIKEPIEELIEYLIFNANYGEYYRYVDTVESLLDLFSPFFLLAIYELAEDMSEYRYFGNTAVVTIPANAMEKDNVSLSCNVLHLCEGALHKLAASDFGKVVNYTYTLGMQVYQDMGALDPIDVRSTTITGDGEHTFNFTMDKYYHAYYYEPYLKVNFTVEVDLNARARAKLSEIPAAYAIKLTDRDLGTVLKERECIMYGKKEKFECEHTELRKALVKFYETTGGKNWNGQLNWCSEKPMREWHGIDIKDNTITISLSENNLKGEINLTLPDDLDIVLDVGNNYLTSINLSESQTLNQLKCYGNSLNSLDVSGCVSLKTLQAHDNGSVTSQQMTLDAYGCTSLTSLVLYSTNLTDVDISGCTSLTYFNREDEPLARLKARDCTSLVGLKCHRTGLTELDLTGCTSLPGVSNIGNQLSTLSISGCTSLESMYFWGNESSSLKISDNASLKSLVLTNSTGDITLDGLTGLTSLKNGGTTLTLNNCSSLEFFGSDGQMTALTISNCKSLTKISTDYDELQTLHISGCPALDILDCSWCGLTDLQIAGSPELKELSCGKNKLTSLDVSGFKSLEILSCNDNQLTSLAVSGMKKLKFLDASGNSFTTFDASGCESLETLGLSQKGITSLNLSGCTSYKSLYWSNWYPLSEHLDLQTLDVSGCTSLEYINLSANKLTELNVKGCTALEELFCQMNELTTLDVSGCTKLKKLGCQANKLTWLEAEGCMQIESISCDNNQITREIPDWFARIKHASYDRRYHYDIKAEWGGPVTFTYKDNGVGWWFKGEPERGYHTWTDTILGW